MLTGVPSVVLPSTTPSPVFSEKGLFYIVDFNKSKPFCRETGIKFVPAGVEHAQEIPLSS